MKGVHEDFWEAHRTGEADDADGRLQTRGRKATFFQVDDPNKCFSSKTRTELSYPARREPNRPSSTLSNAFWRLKQGGYKLCAFYEHWEVPDGGQKKTALPKASFKKSLKHHPRAPLEPPLRKFSVLVGNFTRKSKSPAPAPMPRNTGGDLK